MTPPIEKLARELALKPDRPVFRELIAEIDTLRERLATLEEVLAHGHQADARDSAKLQEFEAQCRQHTRALHDARSLTRELRQLLKECLDWLDFPKPRKTELLAQREAVIQRTRAAIRISDSETNP